MIGERMHARTHALSIRSKRAVVSVEKSKLFERVGSARRESKIVTDAISLSASAADRRSTFPKRGGKKRKEKKRKISWRGIYA